MKISVALAYYDGAEFIEPQLTSILEQLGDGDEVIVSVDRAFDGSMDLLKQWEEKDGRVFLTNGPAKGVVKNFEHAIRMCSGELIFLSDQDDIWLPGKVERVKQAFYDKEVMAVLHDAKIVDENLQELEPSFFKLRHSETGFLKNLWRNSYVGCCMALRKELVDRIFPIPDTIYMHDYWIGATAEQIGRVEMIEEPLILYRRHSRNVTEMKHGSIFFMLEKRWNMLITLLKWNQDRKKQEGKG
ncbi:MAG: glycosyltransferase family 2 protein [Lachnospiraceae bacterium]|nr:glycosyltransferase family 2 protein [Lachnospiraceae bacterium]